MRREINYSHRKAIQATPVEVTVNNSAAPVEVHQQRPVTERDVWLAVAVAVAGASNSTKVESVVNWADSAADRFRKRFGGAA